ncbi:unnamed protein product, partial [Urochloa humidicola]
AQHGIAATAVANGRGPRPRAALLPTLLRRRPLPAPPTGALDLSFTSTASASTSSFATATPDGMLRLAHLHLICELAHSHLVRVFLCRLKSSSSMFPLFALKVIESSGGGLGTHGCASPVL